MSILCARDHERERAGALHALDRQQLHNGAAELAGDVDGEQPLRADEQDLASTRGPWFGSSVQGSARRCACTVRAGTGAHTSSRVRSRPTWSIPPVSCQKGGSTVDASHNRSVGARQGYVRTMPKKQAAHKTTYHGKAGSMNP